MAKLSGAAWTAHNLGLAACFGGQLFGKLALNANLDVVGDEEDRGKLLNTAWNGYNLINAASFATAAATWFPGRLGLSGKEIDQQTRNLVLAKDVLFAVGGLAGLASVIQGRALADQAPGGAVPIADGTTPSSRTPEKAAALLRSVNLLGNANIAVIGGIIGVTSLLAMKSSESTTFSGISRLLP
ncbi:MAG: hypothetical protein AVDCRST_MAG22-1294 [uncultured Rubrobacteraceae bacterium]|uniref:Uncharacterized protein n=1 Tax=uncultured Rubrobacteraceae bacterium TaxID=349277 RepID=A0A6J4NV39_9ACTN|nr:MAG: hypothetical protein AVDCRST_MAG22-1294 [uncultured Rubrobacteraceae bacterium]